MANPGAALAALAPPAQEEEAYDGTKYTKQEIAEALLELTDGLRWLLLDQFKVSRIDSARLVMKGFKAEFVWRQTACTRTEVLQASLDVMGIVPDTPERKTLRLQATCVWASCKEAAEEQ